MESAEDAFRFMAQARHIGKIGSLTAGAARAGIPAAPPSDRRLRRPGMRAHGRWRTPACERSCSSVAVRRARRCSRRRGRWRALE
jgi:hypothetical protein